MFSERLLHTFVSIWQLPYLRQKPMFSERLLHSFVPTWQLSYLWERPMISEKLIHTPSPSWQLQYLQEKQIFSKRLTHTSISILTASTFTREVNVFWKTTTYIRIHLESFYIYKSSKCFLKDYYIYPYPSWKLPYLQEQQMLSERLIRYIRLHLDSVHNYRWSKCFLKAHYSTSVSLLMAAVITRRTKRRLSTAAK